MWSFMLVLLYWMNFSTLCETLFYLVKDTYERKKGEELLVKGKDNKKNLQRAETWLSCVVRDETPACVTTASLIRKNIGKLVIVCWAAVRSLSSWDKKENVEGEPREGTWAQLKSKNERGRKKVTRGDRDIKMEDFQKAQRDDEKKRGNVTIICVFPRI